MSDTIGGSNFGTSNTIGGSNFGGGGPGAVAAVGPTTFAATIGDGATTVFPVAHNLGTLDTHTQLFNPITGAEILPTAYTAVHTSPNVTTITFVAAPAVGAARVVIQK